MEQYDAAVIGAGAEGLAAAAILARAGLRTIVLERNSEPGGRCRTIEFHPGFRASPYSDELAAIPHHLFWALDLARRGALFVTPPTMTALWRERSHSFRRKDCRAPEAALHLAIQTLRDEALTRATRAAPRRSGWRLRSRSRPPWPGEDWARVSLTEVVGEAIRDRDATAHSVSAALCGRAADPSLNGTALHLLAAGNGSGMPRGGLGTLARVLAQLARDAGATVSCGLEVTDVRHRSGRVTGLALADGTELAAGGIISTLDLKRTFLSLFKWEDLPRPTAERVNRFRYAAASARILVALESLPESTLLPDALRGPIAIAPEADEFALAYASWRSAVLPERLPLTVRFVSAVDPSLAPEGHATMTVTVGCVPHRFFDGAWTHAKRDQLLRRTFAAIEDALPGTTARIVGLKLIVPPDIEDEIGRTEGDLSSGEIAPDQMLAMRPWTADHLEAPLTALHGLFLAGSSTTAGVLATCASGAAAAAALIANRKWSSSR